MFERYTESARRALFFARFEASQLGSRTIETEHLLLGLIRQRQGLLVPLLGDADVSNEAIREAVRARVVFQANLPASVEIPFSDEAKQALIATAEEADLLCHSYIGVEHLLLGLLREPGSIAGAILTSRGLQLAATRDRIVGLSNERQDLATVGASDTRDLLRMVDEIEIYAGELMSVPAVHDAPAWQALVSAIHLLRQRLEHRID